MTVKVRPYRKGGWEVDILIRLDDGRKFRERRKSPVSTKDGSRRWGQDRERYLIKHGPDADRDSIERKVPTFAEFAPRYIEGYAKANRLKPATIYAKETMLRLHIIPVVGGVGLDEFGEEHVGQIRAARTGLKTGYLNAIVGLALHMVEMGSQWKVCPARKIAHKRLKHSAGKVVFYEFDEYERVVAAARRLGAEHHLVVLLGGDAGLRRGEMIALEWGDVDFRRGSITVARTDWDGQVGTTKGDKIRTVPMTKRLRASLQAHRHLVGPRVLYRKGRKGPAPMNATTLRRSLGKALELAGLPVKGPHCLRHTFCSHLAMRGAPARVIQELAGHVSIATTQQYMHLSPGALQDAIALLEPGWSGESGETGGHRG